MKHRGNGLVGATLASLVLALTILPGTLVFAQPPIVIAAESNGATSVKPQSTISKSGSYTLTRNIVNNSKNGADSVLVTASNVTINLLGYTIMSTTPTSGSGINATGQTNVVITNGIIMGFGGSAIVAGNGARISGITATNNGSGITCGVGCLARDNVFQGNNGGGMSFSDATSGYLGNVMQGNSGNTVGNSGQVSGGTSLGQNVCNGVAC
jgi:hypothetical protein